MTNAEQTRVDQAADQIADVRSGFVMLCYGRNVMYPFEKRVEFCETVLKPQLKQLDKYMAGHKFVAGDKISYVDFMFWEMLDHMFRFGTAFG